MTKHAEYTEGIASDGAAILKDGHTMFVQDVVKDLNRKSYIEGELISIRAENKRLEGEVSDLITGHIKIELHQKEIHAIEQKELHDRAEKAENMLIISTAAFKQECDRSHVLAVSLSDTEGAVLDLIEANDRNASKLQSIVCALEIDPSAVNLESGQLKLIVDAVVKQAKRPENGDIS